MWISSRSALWPEKLDVERFFTKLIFGFLKVLDALVQIPDCLTETIVGYFQKNVFTETTEGPEHELVDKLRMQYDKKVDTVRLISSSLSFGLLLACAGLFLTIVYILFH